MNYVDIGIKYQTKIFIESFLKGWCTLAVGKNVSNIMPSLLALAVRIISIFEMSPKAAKAGTIVTVACCCVIEQDTV